MQLFKKEKTSEESFNQATGIFDKAIKQAQETISIAEKEKERHQAIIDAEDKIFTEAEARFVKAKQKFELDIEISNSFINASTELINNIKKLTGISNENNSTN